MHVAWFFGKFLHGENMDIPFKVLGYNLKYIEKKMLIPLF
jgi:hypothetical protein